MKTSRRFGPTLATFATCVAFADLVLPNPVATAMVFADLILSGPSIVLHEVERAGATRHLVRDLLGEEA